MTVGVWGRTLYNLALSDYGLTKSPRADYREASKVTAAALNNWLSRDQEYRDQADLLLASHHSIT